MGGKRTDTPKSKRKKLKGRGPKGRGPKGQTAVVGTKNRVTKQVGAKVVESQREWGDAGLGRLLRNEHDA